MKLKIVNPPTLADIVMRCVSDDVETRDLEGRIDRGSFTNLKRTLGRTVDFAFVVQQLARTVPPGHAVAACNEDAWPLVGVIAVTLGIPATLMRRAPGDDPKIGDGRLAGERLPPGTPIRLIDDLVYAGHTLRSAREALTLVGLDAKTASVIVWTYRADAAKDELAAAGITEITSLIHQSQV